MPSPSAAPATAPPAPTRYRVYLYCPTPIAQQALEVEADSPEEAWQKFCAANGITDSEHPRNIEKV